ncbi:MAG TPA: SDR family oxidoreductase [Bacteroidota bacterium]|jgi:NAD(P)-dependent dehydrogenase (short-subunit alcohol dehydrogenase family)
MKSALVTGSSRGIGKAAAQMLAKHGWRVAVHYNSNASTARETVASLNGDDHFSIQADLGISLDCRRMMKEVLERVGKLDLLVNNAGIYDLHPPTETGEQDWVNAWERTLQVNLTSPALLCYLAARHMMQNREGRIINISSRGAFRGEPDAPAYGASKAGLNAMSQSFAKALAPYNILVFVVAPGWVETDMASPYLDGPDGKAFAAQSPLGRAATPEEIGRTILFLATDAPASMTGAIIDVNGASYLRT